MGIYIVDYENGKAGQIHATGNRASNVLFTYDGDDGRWASSTAVYWRDQDTPIDIYGYYPGQNYIEQPTAYAFEVQTDQSTEAANGELGGYEQSDLLWGKATKIAPTTEQIVVRYNHILAGVRVHLNRGTGVSDTEWAKLEKIVLVENTQNSATVDLSTGAILSSHQEGAGVGSETGSVTPIRMLPQTGDDFRAIVIPQTIDTGQPLISITLDGQTYSHALTSAMNYEASKLHNFTITINKREATGDYETQLADDGITPWTNDESSHQFSAVAYAVVDCPEPGQLEQSIRKAGYDPATLQSLKVTGQLTEEDIEYLRMMPWLKNLNLKEVKLKNISARFRYEYEGEYIPRVDDVLPSHAFNGNTTLRSLVLPSSLKALGHHSLAYMQLANSTLEIPDGVTHIGQAALHSNEYNGMTLILPTSIDSIETEAFAYCQYSCEFRMTDNLKYVDDIAFAGTSNFYGVFHLPTHLEHLGHGAFGYMGTGWSGGGNPKFTGEIEIPQSMKEIPAGFAPALINRVALNIPRGVRRIDGDAFHEGSKFSSLSLPEGLLQILDGAFSGCNMPFPLSLPDGLVSVGDGSFSNCDLEGELTFPESCISIGARSFYGNHFTRVTFGSQAEDIGDEAFAINQQLQYVCLPKYLESIGKYAFAWNSGIQTIVCLSQEPPTVGQGAFEGIYFDKCILQVPESAIEAYRKADGWKQFQNITPYRELAVNIPEVLALDKGLRREGIVRAEGAWEVTSCPSWCQVEPMTGSGKAEVAITINSQPKGAADREGQVVFSLKDRNYTVSIPVRQLGYEYGEDETIVLQRASAGAPREVPLFIVGEGYSAEDIQSGKYLQEVKEQMELLFSCEPYKTYRPYFTVSTAIAVSPESGIPVFYGSPVFGQTHFDTSITFGSPFCDMNAVWSYAVEHGEGITWEREGQTNIVVLLNTTQGSNYVDLQDNGRSITLLRKSIDAYPYDQRGYVLHTVGGLAFGKLSSEYVEHFTFAKSCTCPGCLCWSCYWKYKVILGWYENISASGKMNEVSWSHLIFHEKYAPYVDVYEGAYKHARGFYRSEEQSVMSTYIPYFNTISRESIVKRIMRYAGEEYTFEKFVAKDKIEIPEY